MSIWKRYVLTYDDTNHQVEVAVSDAPETVAMLQEINSFWSGDKERLAAANGDVLTAVLRMLCTRVLASTLTEHSAFDVFARGEVEGWPPLDGSSGIKLLSVDYLDLGGDVSIASFPFSIESLCSVDDGGGDQ